MTDKNAAQKTIVNALPAHTVVRWDWMGQAYAVKKSASGRWFGCYWLANGTRCANGKWSVAAVANTCANLTVEVADGIDSSRYANN